MGWIIPSFKPCIRCGQLILVNDLQEQACPTCKRFLRDQEKATRAINRDLGSDRSDDTKSGGWPGRRR